MVKGMESAVPARENILRADKLRQWPLSRVGSDYILVRIFAIGIRMTNRITTILFALALLVQSCVVQAETAVNLSADAEYQAQLSRSATYQVDFRVAVTAPAETKKLRVWLPLAEDNRAQRIENRQIETFPRDVKPSIHTEPFFGNTFAYFEFDSPQGTQLISHQFTAQLQQLNWQVDYSSVLQPESWSASLAPYQRIDPRAKDGDPLRDVLQSIGPATRSSADRLVSAMQWVDQNLTYDHSVASLSGDPMHGLLYRRGHCSDYHGLCSTLAQKVGYPSRVVYGLQMFDKASPSHCKLEVFLPPYGWVTYDLSETQKLVIQIGQDKSLSPQQRDERVNFVKQRTMRGFRENTWLQVTRGTNYQLAPPASRPVPLIRTIYAEADGEPLIDFDPSNPDRNDAFWVTMHRVDGDDAARKFQTFDKARPAP